MLALFRHRPALLLPAIGSACLPCLAGVADARGAAEPSGRELYESACATCHGTDGTGAPRERVGFDVPLPDFSDCGFTTREPTDDWIAITHRGGPARGFDEMMPAFGAALSEDEIGRVLGHIRGFCDDPAWPRGELNLPRPLYTEKAYPEDELVLTTAVALEGPASIDSEIVYETRIGARNQLEVTVPFGVRERAGGWAEGAGDVGFGLKRAMFHSSSSGTIFSLAGEVFVPSGDEADGFGTGTFVFEPFLALGQIVPVAGFVQLHAGVELPADTDRARREGFARVAFGQSFSQGRFGRSWTPMVEVLAARELLHGARTEWDFVPQLQVTLNQRQHVMLDVGARMPMTEIAARPTELVVYVLWDWFDGGLDEGW